MDLKKAIFKEHSRKQAHKIADYVGNNPLRFKQLVEVFAAGPFRVSQRASWPLSTCIERHPHLLKPHFKTILGMLNKPGTHDAVRRNIVRLLQFVDVPKRYQGMAIDRCFELLVNPKMPVAIRAFSMTVLANLIKEEKDLQRELRIVLEDQLPYGSPGFVSRARKVLKGL
jgi:hypothetical protein